MQTVYRIYWDNGNNACGTFPQQYETEEQAEAAANAIEAENIAEGIWDSDGSCEVISEEIADEYDCDEYGDLLKAGLSRGQP
jgi:hypothetical protein